MESLYSYIGLSSKVSEVDSGLYVDALPDISINLVDKLTDNEGEMVEELWATIEKRGILKFRTLFIAEVNRCHHISKIDVCECLIEENVDILATSLWYLLGAELMYERISSARLNRFTTIEKSKAKELRNSFMDLFTDELQTAVAGIDVNDNDCTDEVIQDRNIINTHYAII